MKKIQLVAMLLLGLAACSPKVENGGYVKEDDIKSQIVVGQTTRDQVREKLGSPSTQSSFGNEAWYYITSRKEAYAFFRPEVAAEDTVRISFDNNGVVSNIETFSKKDGKAFALVKRTTPTEGHTMGFFEQVLGNLGRFNRPADASDTSAPGRKPGP